MPEPLELAPVDLAVARHRLAGLLGQLLADGLRAPEAVGALPALAHLLDVDPDALAAEHHRWFAYELSPHESAFLDGQLDGPATAAVRATWATIGFAPGRTDLADDHVGIALAALAHLFAMEAEARLDGLDPAPVLRLQERVAAHLMAWLPLLAAAVEGPWAPVVTLADELVRSVGVPEPPRAAGRDLHDLLVPARSGWVCTWTALRRVSEEVELPLGFGSKRRALQALLDDPRGGPALMAAVEGSSR